MLSQVNHKFSPQIYMQPCFKGETSTIPNFQQVDATLYRGGKPTIEHLQELKRQGVDTVICFRTGYQGNEFNEAQAVTNSGMKYVHLPFISWNDPPEEHVQKFFEVMDKARANREKVFIHCTHGKDRTGLFAGMYKVHYGLDSIDNCVKEMLELGHNQAENPNLIPYLRNYASKL